MESQQVLFRAWCNPPPLVITKDKRREPMGTIVVGAGCLTAAGQWAAADPVVADPNQPCYKKKLRALQQLPPHDPALSPVASQCNAHEQRQLRNAIKTTSVLCRSPAEELQLAMMRRHDVPRSVLQGWVAPNLQGPGFLRMIRESYALPPPAAVPLDTQHLVVYLPVDPHEGCDDDDDDQEEDVNTQTIRSWGALIGNHLNSLHHQVHTLELYSDVRRDDWSVFCDALLDAIRGPVTKLTVLHVAADMRDETALYRLLRQMPELQTLSLGHLCGKVVRSPVPPLPKLQEFRFQMWDKYHDDVFPIVRKIHTASSPNAVGDTHQLKRVHIDWPDWFDDGRNNQSYRESEIAEFPRIGTLTVRYPPNKRGQRKDMNSWRKLLFPNFVDNRLYNIWDVRKSATFEKVDRLVVDIRGLLRVTDNMTVYLLIRSFNANRQPNDELLLDALDEATSSASATTRPPPSNRAQSGNG